jgi:hypothetical protein
MARTIEGEPAGAALRGALAQVTALVPYLTAERLSGPLPAWENPAVAQRPLPADGDWIPCQALIDDPPWLGRIIRSTGSGLGTDDPVVAASAFVQSYSFRVLTLTVSCLAVSGVVPDAGAPRLAIALARHWPSLVAYGNPSVMVLDPSDMDLLRTGSDANIGTDADAITDALRFVVDHAIDLHLHPLIDAVRSGLGAAIGERLLWGNVAVSAATAFRTMQGCLGAFVEPLGRQFFALAPPPLQGLGSFFVVEHAGRRGWFWERTNCCLLDRLPGAVRCADCSLTPTEQRRHAYRESLEAS